MRSPAACSHRSEAYVASASATAITSTSAAMAASSRVSPPSSSNGAGRSSRRSTRSASGHGFARSAAVSTAVAPPAPASARQLAQHVRLEHPARGRHAATCRRTSSCRIRRGARHAAEIDRRRLRLEREEPPDLARQRGGIEPVGIEHAQRAEALEPARAAQLLVLLRRRVRDDERRDARADHLEHGVVARLADRHGRRAQLRGEVGHRPHQLGAAQARDRRVQPVPCGSRAGAGRRSGASSRRSTATACAAPRSRSRSRRSPTRPPPAETRMRPRGRIAGAGAASRDDEPGVADRHARAACAARTSPPAARTRGRCARARRRGGRPRAPAARSSCACWFARRLTRMSRTLHAVRAPLARAASSSGTSSRANFARPNGNSSTRTTCGADARGRWRGSAPAAPPTPRRRRSAGRGSRTGRPDRRRAPAARRARHPSGGRISLGTAPPHRSTTRKRSVSPAHSAYDRVRWPRPTECWQ